MVRSHTTARIVCAFAALVSTAVAADTTTTVVDVPTRNVTQRFLYVRPDAPIANLVALPGSDGLLNIQDDGTMPTTAGACFPVGRTRNQLAASGIAVALVDAASDGTVRNFDDVVQVIRYMQARDNVPTWIIGGSASTTAVLDMAVHLPAAMPVGAIFFSPIDVGTVQATAIRRPTQVIHHLLDATTADALYMGLTNAPARESITFTGGSSSGCGYHLYQGLNAEFATAIAGFVGRYSPSIASPAPDLDQHGLGGVWYDPASSGQGFALEVYDLAPGNGAIAGGWFTFDTASGGADRQRWYSVSGPMPSGAKSAALTVYRNTGGNFDAPPTTTAQSVGTAAIEFATCDSAIFTYSLADGRWGSIPLSRATPNVECFASSVRIVVDDFGLSGNWFDPATSGQGLVVEVNPVSGTLFFAWYTYAPNAAASGVAGQRWYTGQASYLPHGRTVPVTLYETIGGSFDVATPVAQATSAVGTATLTFASCSNATLGYALTGGTSAGKSGTIALQRAGPVPAGCVF